MATKKNTSILAGLEIVEEARKAGGANVDKLTRVREKMLEAVGEQVELANAFVENKPLVVKRKRTVQLEDGTTKKQDVETKGRPWFFEAVDGSYAINLRYGNRPVSLNDKGHCAVMVEAKDKIADMLRTLGEAIKEGELDKFILQAAQRKART